MRLRSFTAPDPGRWLLNCVIALCGSAALCVILALPVYADVIDDFERGINGDAVGGSWTVIAGQVKISTAQKKGGTRSGQWVQGSPNGGATLPFIASDNGVISFWAYKADGGGFTIAHGNGTTALFIQLENNENISYYNGSIYVDTGANFPINTWAEITLKDFKWTAHTVDIYLNGASVANDVNYGVVGGAYTNVFYIGISNATGYIDDVDINTLPPAGVTTFTLTPNSDNTILAAWTRSATATGVILVRSYFDYPATYTSPVVIYNGSSANFTDTGLFRYTTIYYRIWEYNAGGYSGYVQSSVGGNNMDITLTNDIIPAVYYWLFFGTFLMLVNIWAKSAIISFAVAAVFTGVFFQEELWDSWYQGGIIIMVIANVLIGLANYRKKRGITG